MDFWGQLDTSEFLPICIRKTQWFRRSHGNLHYKDYVVIPLDHVTGFNICTHKWEKVVEATILPKWISKPYWATSMYVPQIRPLMRSTMSTHKKGDKKKLQYYLHNIIQMWSLCYECTQTLWRRLNNKSFGNEPFLKLIRRAQVSHKKVPIRSRLWSTLIREYVTFFWVWPHFVAPLLPCFMHGEVLSLKLLTCPLTQLCVPM